MIGRFQPFHSGHFIGLDSILKKFNAREIEIIVVQKIGNIDLYKNPIPLDLNVKYLKECLSEKYGNTYDIKVFGVYYRNYLDILLKLINFFSYDKSKKYILVTADIKRLIMFKITSILYKLFGINLRIFYLPRVTSGTKIRESIRRGELDYFKYIPCPKDEIIYYINAPAGIRTRVAGLEGPHPTTRRRVHITKKY